MTDILTFIFLIIGFALIATANIYAAWKTYQSNGGKPDVTVAFLIAAIFLLTALFILFSLYILHINA